MNIIQASQFISTVWPIILWIGGTIIGAILFYSNVKSKLQDLDTRVEKLEEKDEALVKLNELVIAIDAKLTVLLPDYKGK